MAASHDDQPEGDRRRSDRRCRDEAMPFTERRKDQRRSGDDRRGSPRVS